MNIKMFQMGFGESIMVCEDRECLLIDCGSESRKRAAYFDCVKTELMNYDTCSVMLSHFHEDHINGFHVLTTSLRHKFKKVYIPHIFTTGAHNNQVDFMIMQYLLEQIPYLPRKTYHLWDLLNDLVTSQQSICLLQRGERFQEANTEFEVLWPVPKEIINDGLCEALCAKTPVIAQLVPQIHILSDQISRSFLSLETEDLEAINWELLHEEQREFVINLEELCKVFLEGMRNLTETMSKAEIRKNVKDCYRKIDKNSASIVCQMDRRDKPALFTGDITQSIMKKIAHNAYQPRMPLKTHYYAIKAPHHGTYSDHYFNFGPYASYDYLLISNGETTKPTARRGQISSQYILRNGNYQICCTNTQRNRCEGLSNSLFQPCNCCVCNSGCTSPIIEI